METCVEFGVNEVGKDINVTSGQLYSTGVFYGSIIHQILQFYCLYVVRVHEIAEDGYIYLYNKRQIESMK